MSVADVDICDVRSIIGTGDCELQKSDIKNDFSFASQVASDILSEVVENALDVALSKTNFQESETNPVGDISAKTETLHDQNCEETVPSIGVGDQLITEEILTSETTANHPLVEKKNRLTDLVRNSKQILAKFLNENKQQAELEIKEEKLLQVIELDCIKSEHTPYRCPGSHVNPEEIPLPSNDDDFEEQPAEIPDDSSMDVIQLSSDMKEASGDDCKRMTFPIAAGSSKTKGFIAKCRTLRGDRGKLKEKKWNFGSKIINYIRRHQAKRDEKAAMEEQKEKNEEL